MGGKSGKKKKKSKLAGPVVPSSLPPMNRTVGVGGGREGGKGNSPPGWCEEKKKMRRARTVSPLRPFFPLSFGWLFRSLIPFFERD